MILSNRVVIVTHTVDCPGCATRFEATHRVGEAFLSSCPRCGFSPEAIDAP